MHDPTPALARLAALARGVAAPDPESIASARARQARLTKPPGSLGVLERLVEQAAGAFRSARPALVAPAVVVAAADHGVAARGVSAYPQAVTAAMVENFVAGGAAICALARAADARLLVVDAGVRPPPQGSARDWTGVHRAKGAAEAADIAIGPAFAEAAALELIEAGADFADRLGPCNAVALGEMGIANTTPTAAIASAALGVPASAVVGRGTGVDDTGLARKLRAVETAVARAVAARPELANPAARGPGRALALGTELGGGEILFLCGLALGAARRRMLVLLDGYITTAAALLAAEIAPAVRPYLVASHQSREPGHGLLLAHLGLEPLLRLDLALGEGSGAALALSILRASLWAHDSMATFDEAQVPEGNPGP